ncbi:RNA-guided endonuclease InsQ/TnpB family protein [Salmonella enterica]|nr:transposase [Salmonella enterica]EJX4476268.1 transposase [Salmonella enterica]EKS4544749.1 transposase [Salmonella enterica]EKS4549527.1 transposase [Salmonella enterica]EKS4822629.1 transposase [Salmonella enterica]
MKRAYKYRFYPTPDQVELFAQTFGCVRFVYNSILRWRTDAYYDRQEKISYPQASARLTALKKAPEFAWLNDVSCVPLQQSLRHQQAAFSNFFAGRAAYPAFKSKRHKQAATFMNTAFKYKDGCLYMAKSKAPLDVRWSRPLPSVPSSITISKDSAGRYFVSCLCEFEPVSLPITASTVGIDVGLTDLFVTDTGFKTGNPRHTAKYAKRLALLQRRLSKKKKGSKNRAKARLKVARIHAKIADCRLDNLHKLSRKLINENQVVCVESLKVKNMIRNPKLSKAIADAGWGEFVRQLEYKGEWSGRSVVAIDQFFPSSKRCSGCGYTMPKMALNVRSWLCPECGANHDRDVNAAKNIKAVGLTALAHGATVNPKAA